jgi:aminopeptidase N
MLRHLVGDGVFWKGIRKYYDSYKNTNALTEDFRKVMEDVSGMDLETFFNQWVYTMGYPELTWSWTYANGQLQVKINQEQNHYLFNFPLEIGIITGNKMQIKKIEIDSQSNTFNLAVEDKPDLLLFDPEVWLLFEEK